MTLHPRETRLKVRLRPRRADIQFKTAPGIESASIVESFCELGDGSNFPHAQPMQLRGKSVKILDMLKHLILQVPL